MVRQQPKTDTQTPDEECAKIWLAARYGDKVARESKEKRALIQAEVQAAFDAKMSQTVKPGFKSTKLQLVTISVAGTIACIPLYWGIWKLAGWLWRLF